MATTNDNTGPTSNVGLLEGKRILQYPTGLGSTAQDKYGADQHYMIFRINTDSKTSMLKDDTATGTVVVAAGTRQGTGIASTPRFNVYLKTDDKDMRIKHGDAVADKPLGWLTQKGMQRLDKVIVLPMPMEHTLSTRLKYNDEYESTLITKVGDMVNTSGGGLASDGITQLKNAVISGAANTIKSGATSTQAGLNEDRRANNPKKEVMFESFGYRSFSFSFQFAPKTEEESEMVKDIIETFRYYALPEISEGKLHYIFPSEFEITFMQGSTENIHIPKITTSVLRSISVNYMPNSVWSTLPNGAPLSLSISMDFLELEMIDRSRVYKKDSPHTSGY